MPKSQNKTLNYRKRNDIYDKIWNKLTNKWIIFWEHWKWRRCEFGKNQRKIQDHNNQREVLNFIMKSYRRIRNFETKVHRNIYPKMFGFLPTRSQEQSKYKKELKNKKVVFFIAWLKKYDPTENISAAYIFINNIHAGTSQGLIVLIHINLNVSLIVINKTSNFLRFFYPELIQYILILLFLV